MIEFDDGTTIDPKGDIRIEEKQGTFYVVGEGNCVPCETREEAEKLLSRVMNQDLAFQMKLFKSENVRKRVSEEFKRDPENKPKLD
jgi:hypothetical protein